GEFLLASATPVLAPVMATDPSANIDRLADVEHGPAEVHRIATEDGVHAGLRLKQGWVFVQPFKEIRFQTDRHVESPKFWRWLITKGREVRAPTLHLFHRR